MPTEQTTPPGAKTGTPASVAFRVVAIYAVVSVLWILFSDQVAHALFSDPAVLTRVESMKGALFVLVTSGMLFVLIRGYTSRLRDSGELLSHSEQRFRRIIDASPVPMAVKDASDTITLANPAFSATLGYTLSDVPNLDAWWRNAYPDEAYRREVIDEWMAEVDRSNREGDYFQPIEARIRCKDGSDKFMLVGAANLDSSSGDQVVVFYDLTERQQAETAVLESRERLAHVLKSVIGLIGKVVEARDPYTKGHEEGVARIGRLIAEAMGLPEADVDGIEVAGLVHDVGKLGVPAEILSKPGKITTVEYEIIKTHPEMGHSILADVDFGWPVAETVLQHHERMDGSGYPRGLRGDEISLPARVLMVADVVEATAAHRPYRPAHGIEAAIDAITSEPERFDPDVVAACVKLHQEGRIEVQG